MLQSEQTRFKSEIVQALLEQLNFEIEELKVEVLSIQDSANEETKSSSGDKYETGRAMAHLELEKLMGRLAAKQGTLTQLQRLNIAPKTFVESGSVVDTSVGVFFIGVNGSFATVDNRKITSITPASPLAIALRGAPAGSRITFNGREIIIHAVY